MVRPLILSAVVIGPLVLSSAWAQQLDADPHAGHDASTMPMDDMDSMDHEAMSNGDMSMDMNMDDMDMNGGMDHGMQHDDAAMEQHDMSSMDSMSMPGRAAPTDARDPHAYSGGYDFGPYPLRLADQHNFGALLIDRLESVRTDDNTSTTIDLQAWYGRDYDRIVLKAEGAIDNDALDGARSEILWGHAVAPYWNAQLGLRYDSGESPDQTWLALGIQGLAPYWFEVDASAYIGAVGRTAVSVEAEYDLLLTQRLILQPRFEADLYGKDDAKRGVGSGLSEAVLGLRLRYEIRRQFSPYVGVEWAGKYGRTADYTRAAGQDAEEARTVVGLRCWF